MDYRNILATGFVLLCAAVFVHSLNAANAFSNGPLVSAGNNPIENRYIACNGNWPTLFSNTSSQTFLITDIVKSASNTGYNVILQKNGQVIWEAQENLALQTGITVAPGESIECYHHGYGVSMSGYYIH